MSDLLWPGDHRAGDLLSDQAFLRAALEVEAAWSQALVDQQIAPREAAVTVDQMLDTLPPDILTTLAVEAEASGSPVGPLVTRLRRGLGGEAGTWVHRGLTSQDVVDTALMRCAADALVVVQRDLVAHVTSLTHLVRRHRDTTAVARTLTQHAVPTTIGLRMAGWLTGILDAHDEVAAVVLPAQLGGAAGTLAGAVELAAHLPDPVDAVTRVSISAADALGLTPSAPWHTVRTPITRLGDATTRCTDAWGHLANDVLAGSRSEVRELSEGSAGGSSTMPHKANPTLSVLVRRSALAAPGLAASLHLTAADAVDERPPGSWHLEWATLRQLLRRTVIAGAQVTDLLNGLQVHPDRSADLLEGAEQTRSEQHTMASLTGRSPAASYLGASGALVDACLARATSLLADQKPA